MENLDSYLNKAIAAPDLALDIAFLIRPYFLSEGDKQFSIQGRRKGDDSLYQPALSLFKGMALSNEVEKKEKELVKYYASVVKCGKKFNKDLRSGDHYFWLRPLIVRNKNIEFDFPWYDTFAEAKAFLEILTSGKTGWIFDDMDQGWRLAIYADEERFYILSGDWEENKYSKPLFVSRQKFSTMAKETLERTEKQIKILTGEIEKDYWTKRKV